ncbi:mRNA-decapping enzyme 1A-like [Limulus polyphemus]|uniref:mRNA-decapping enzyme 1A-like n=1 Tax=Limulus polyphemus TaxID=6850 RepID=A0ABM1SWD6_LIMPO|nr:mRNA-decapping enzyme 1A-like [Limulus polyphemus]
MMEQGINLERLQKIDNRIIEILDSATQVSLYKFNPKSKEWERMGIEGTLFVYKRSEFPYYWFIIVNMLSTANLIKPLTYELEFQLQSPFLLYCEKKDFIYGISFYEKCLL